MLSICKQDMTFSFGHILYPCRPLIAQEFRNVSYSTRETIGGPGMNDPRTTVKSIVGFMTYGASITYMNLCSVTCVGV